jgi:hypothetical protein
MWVGGQSHAAAALASERDLVPIVQEGGAPGLVLEGCRHHPPTGIRFLDRPARSEL